MGATPAGSDARMATRAAAAVESCGPLAKLIKIMQITQKLRKIYAKNNANIAQR